LKHQHERKQIQSVQSGLPVGWNQMKQLADEELVGYIGKGDQAAYQELVGRYLDRSLALAQRILGNRSDAEDVVQDAFLRLWTHAAQWRTEGARFGTWFYRVVVNRCLDYTRRITPGPLDAVEGLVDSAPDSTVHVYHRQIARQVAVAMAELPDRQRAALALCYYDELSQADAAEVLGVSVGAVESLLVRGRRRLRELLQAIAPDAERGAS
jgi:RNA polymerase sigma-70 factor (ECF subfamily)